MIEKILKKFEIWFGLKIKLDKIEKFPRFREGEIWFAHLGENIGHEENGKGDKFLRPVIIIKKFNQNLFYCVPTSSIKKDNPYYYEIFLEKKNKNIYALLSQIKTMDARRLSYKMTKLSDPDLLLLKKKVSKLFLGKN